MKAVVKTTTHRHLKASGKKKTGKNYLVLGNGLGRRSRSERRGTGRETWPTVEPGGSTTEGAPPSQWRAWEGA